MYTIKICFRFNIQKTTSCPKKTAADALCDVENLEKETDYV